ncbi:uncharacterized protein [Physcomitrium patens]|uniref:Uncharacterized protein n=1 Tax=Physcomitrium patens TaxID=3218 RepID=A0A2K1KCT0_PHYPA|nr:uncharacterized protein LOC112285185 [Physcomitrium patens]PNR51582.1 hypothetical protein PHYPA_010769 [Physcomitrium patens]|eukprot:XP_024381581.1 uncharacterized protein LOC112285185 [Physcomitrella patens]
MKRSQLEEENCGHWEYDVPCDVASSDGVGTVDPDLVATNFGMTMRRLRFTRALTREYSGKSLSLEELSSRVRENHSTSQRVMMALDAVGPTEGVVVRRLPVLHFGSSMVSDERDGCETIITPGVLDATEYPMLEVCGRNSAGTVPISHGLEEERNRDVSSDATRPVGSNAEVDVANERHDQDELGKENCDPLGQWNILESRSPLPAWFPRRPLQDITNVLASELDNELPQPKKKRNKKITSGVPPQLELRCEIPAKNAMSLWQPKALSCVASKKCSNLRKNFR